MMVYSVLLLKNAGLQKRINFWANQTIPKIQQKRTDIYSWANARVLLKYKKSCPKVLFQAHFSDYSFLCTAENVYLCR
jgi:hypothetical protein